MPRMKKKQFNVPGMKQPGARPPMQQQPQQPAQQLFGQQPGFGGNPALKMFGK